MSRTWAIDFTKKKNNDYLKVIATPEAHSRDFSPIYRKITVCDELFETRLLLSRQN